MKHGLEILVAALIALLAPACAADDVPREILEIDEGLYRVTSGAYRSMYWVTDQGIVVIDTIDRGTAEWLKQELAERHNVPVRYVVYSHNHYDHVYGGDVFDDGVSVLVAHELVREDLEQTRADTRLPDITFDNELTLHLGSESLTLRYHGTNNGRGSVSMHFEERGVMFVVNWIVLGRMPWKDLEGYDIQGMIRSTKEVLSLDWEIMVGGHANVGDRADVERYLAYLEALYEAVRDGMLEGRSLTELQSSIRLDTFRDLKNYEEWLPLNIAGVYHTLADRSYMLKRPDVVHEPAARE